MASNSPILLSLISLFFVSRTADSTMIIDDLNRPMPPEFELIVAKNCILNPALRYCNLTPPADLSDIFKSSVVAEHLCNESGNVGCVDSFAKIDLRGRPHVAPLYLSFAFFWKYCPLTILEIDLSNNLLKGSFPSDVFYCSQIHSLDLSHNELTGHLPVENFTATANLTFFNASYNQFSEANVTQLIQRFNPSSFLHSGLLREDHPQGFKISRLLVFLCILSSFVLAVLGLCWLCIKRPDLLPSICRRQNHFTLAMLKLATNNFSGEKLLAKSGKVEIYKGELREGTLIAIEIERGRTSSESRKAFVEECKNLVKLEHKNLVQVLGWCDRREMRAVVTKWINVDSVRRWLSDSPPWKHRLKVMVGVVEAMIYLQEKWPQIGYDLRTNTILLSENMVPLISRFRLGDENNNSKSVYKFGVFLLEMISSKHPREDFEKGEDGFIEWVKVHYSGHARKLMDEKLRKTNVAYEPVKQAIGIGLMCVDVSSNRQPSLVHLSHMIKRVYQSSFLTEPQIIHGRQRSNAGETNHSRHER